METIEKLYLKNFGPIKELDIEIKPLMVFIGESGSGKSAILKLMSLLRWVHKQNNLRSFFKNSKIGTKKEYSRLSSDTLLKTSGLNEFINSNTEIKFQIGETIYGKKGKIPTDAEIRDELTLDKVAFISENRGVLPDIYTDSIPRRLRLPYYLEDTYNNFLAAIKDLDKKEFFIESTKVTLFEKKGLIPVFHIKGEKDNGEKYELKFVNASSGTKTSTYAEIITNYLTQKYNFKSVLEGGFNEFLIKKISEARKMGKTDLNLADFSGNRNLSIFIEEPELSLFPAAQRRLINRLVKDCFVENKQKDCTTRLAFATHSPYILTSLNNLLLAGEIAKSKPEKKEEINKIIPKEYWLTMEQIGVFSIENGIAKPAIYEDENLINGDYLDSLSNEVSEEFSKLLDIKYGEEGN